MIEYKDLVYVLGGEQCKGGKQNICENDEYDMPVVEQLQDVWYSKDLIRWNISTSEASFGPRAFHAAAVFQDAMWIFGGGSPDCKYQNTVWLLGGSTSDIQWDYGHLLDNPHSIQKELIVRQNESSNNTQQEEMGEEITLADFTEEKKGRRESPVPPPPSSSF